MATPPTPVRNIRHLDDKPHMVYELWDSEGGPVYVGMTVHLADRLRTHMASDMWREVADVFATTYSNKAEAASAEASRIRELQPRWNFQCTERASEFAREVHRARRERQRAQP